MILRLIKTFLMLIVAQMVAVTRPDHQRATMGWQVVQVANTGVLAADDILRVPIWVAPFDCELGEVAIINSTLVTGAATNNKHINLVDGGLEGAGNTQIANIDLESGTDLIVGKTLLFDNIQGASAERFMLRGTILELEYLDNGTGLLIEPILLYITYRAANLTA